MRQHRHPPAGSGGEARTSDEERSFRRGDPVHDYWLAHSNGFSVTRRGRRVAVVETVAHDPASGRASALRVRLEGLRRGERLVQAEEVEEVVPGRGVVVLRPGEISEPAREERVARSSAQLVVRAREWARREGVPGARRAGRSLYAETAALSAAAARATAIVYARARQHGRPLALRALRRARRVLGNAAAATLAVCAVLVAALAEVAGAARARFAGRVERESGRRRRRPAHAPSIHGAETQRGRDATHGAVRRDAD